MSISTEKAPTIVKYAYIVFNMPFPFPWGFGHFEFDAFTSVHESNIKDQVEGPQSKHWGEWIGSLSWDELCADKMILSTWTESKTPDVTNGEDEILQEKIINIFRVLPLVAPFSPPGEDAFIFSGRGVISKQGLRAQNIRSFSRVDCWMRSYYNLHYWDDFHKWAQNEVKKPSLLDDWKNCHSHYDRLFLKGKTNRQLLEGFRSFEEAMRGTQLEFKIPNLVRALECVIDCYGAIDFADKVLNLTGTPSPTLPYSIALNTNELLKDLYQLRNDCSHGKPFAYSLEKKLGQLPDGDIIAKYEFLAEWVARKILNNSFVNQSILAHTGDRDTLVNAWKNKLIVP